MNNREGHDRRERQQSCSHGRHKDWFALLRAEVEKTSRAAVAKRMGVSRTAISLVMSGNYGAATDKIAARVLEVFSRIDCPYLGKSISPAECAAHAGRAIPTSSPRAVRHWKACQSCPHHPSQGEPT